MMTNPTLDDLLEGLIVSLENEIMPHVGSPKAYTMCQMVQSLIQEVRQAMPVYDTYIAQEHNEMTKVLRDVAAALGDTTGPEADRIRTRATTLGTKADVPMPADQEPIRAAHQELGYALQDCITDLDVLQRAGNTRADTALQSIRAHLLPRIVRDVATLTMAGGMAGRG
jgi:hypothetical protein